MSDIGALQGYNINNLSDLHGITDDIGGMANAIADMGNAITELTTFAKQKAETLLSELPSKDIMKPVAIGAGVLLGGFLVTGIAANIKRLSEK
jgi:hypothetical protein